MLTVKGIHSAYGPSRALFGIDFAIGRNEIVTLLGRNGMGKTTIIRSIMGILKPLEGSIHFDGRDITDAAVHEIARCGIGLVPEGRQLFPNLTVEENIIIAATPGGRGHWTKDMVLDLFPSLKARLHHLGCNLSGGEQQMVAIGRALMTNPKLLILDEATEGLAPLVRAEIWDCIAKLKQRGQSILLIDKNLAPLLRLADRHYIVGKGQIVWSGGSDALTEQAEQLNGYLGI